MPPFATEGNAQRHTKPCQHNLGRHEKSRGGTTDLNRCHTIPLVGRNRTEKTHTWELATPHKALFISFFFGNLAGPGTMCGVKFFQIGPCETETWLRQLHFLSLCDSRVNALDTTRVELWISANLFFVASRGVQPSNFYDT